MRSKRSGSQRLKAARCGHRRPANSGRRAIAHTPAVRGRRRDQAGGSDAACRSTAGLVAAAPDAFCEFYRSHYRGLNGPTRTLTYGILCNSDVVGMIRMARSDGPDTLETGMWLGRSARGRGIGGRALRLLLDEAARTGARRVVAETSAANAAAIKVLRRCSAVLVFNGSQVHAEIPVRPASSAADTESDG